MKFAGEAGKPSAEEGNVGMEFLEGYPLMFNRDDRICVCPAMSIRCDNNGCRCTVCGGLEPLPSMVVEDFCECEKHDENGRPKINCGDCGKRRLRGLQDGD